MKPEQVWALLKSLPGIRFALMLGGGAVSTAGVASVLIWLQGAGGFPSAEAVWLARINGVVALGLGMTVIVALVMVMLAFGRAGKLSIRGPAGVGADLDFDTKDAPGPGEGDAP